VRTVSRLTPVARPLVDTGETTGSPKRPEVRIRGTDCANARVVILAVQIVRPGRPVVGEVDMDLVLGNVLGINAFRDAAAGKKLSHDSRTGIARRDASQATLHHIPPRHRSVVFSLSGIGEARTRFLPALTGG